MTVSLLNSSKMAVKEIVFWVSIFLAAIGANAAGELSILHSPDSLKFSGESETLESVLKDIFSASLGLSVEEDSVWNGLSITDPFNTPEAVVEVYIDGVLRLGAGDVLESHNYPLIVDEYEPDTYEMVRHNIKQRYTNAGNILVNVKLSDSNELATLFGGIPEPKIPKLHLQHLNPSIEEDFQFLKELGVLEAITDKVNSGAVVSDKVIDLYNFRFRSLHLLSDFHGPNSLPTKEAKTLLGSSLSKLRDAFERAYDGAVLVVAVSTDVAHTRRAVRAAAEEASDVRESLRNGAYSEDYAAVFNIILWFSVAFAFSLIAIVYAIMDMDPGRDSIIYRMTSTRMKKEN